MADFDQFFFFRIVNGGILIGKVLKAYLKYITGRKYCGNGPIPSFAGSWAES